MRQHFDSRGQPIDPPQDYPGVATLMGKPRYARDLIIRNIKGLDLNGLTVLTEAATREYAVTPIIAAAAGARVYAFARDSEWGKAEDAEVTVNKFADMCGVRGRVEVITEVHQMVLEQADIITNLGGLIIAIRALPSDLKPGAVILCMQEKWETREGDIDLKACKDAKIPVVYTEKGELFNYCGALCVKMLLEAGVEIYRSKIVVVSGGCLFADIAATFLEAMGAEVVVSETNWLAETGDCDAVVVADLRSAVATGTGLGVPVIRLVEDGRMGKTLAHLGVKPVIEIHALGFRTVAEFLAGRKVSGQKRSASNKGD